MLRTFFLATLAAATLAGAASSAFAGTEFTVHNESGRDIVELFVSPDIDSHWGHDMLDGHVLPAGAHAEVEMNSNHCVFDILVAVRGGQTQELYGIDLCYYDGVEIN